MNMRRTAAAVFVSSLMTSSAFAGRPFDHLQCFKIKDDVDKTKYTATITPGDAAFAEAEGCTIKSPAKLLCVEAVKDDVEPDPPGAPSGRQAQPYLCYKTKCPAAAADVTALDQFGVHGVTVKKTGFVCAPATIDPTSTTTTLPPTTTTLLEPECVAASDCPGTDTDCSVRTCTGGECGFDFASPGTATSSQTPGDCQQQVCDGSGGTTIENHDTDVPIDDGNQCTLEVCSSGSPSFPNAPDGTPCNQNGGLNCFNGQCVM
ncbi:MAG TPA: hypothetical protein VEL28_15235 [Candidatus Binatia bacterium]|nr:hypothetical protein [Candidatus Binatia bacterium]